MEIILPDGKSRDVTLVGRGTFSTAYLYAPSPPPAHQVVYLFTRGMDLSKDILSHVHREYNKHIPPMAYLGRKDDYDVYQTKFYKTPVVKGNCSPKTWDIILNLRQTHAKACAEFVGDIVAKNECIDFNYYIAEHAPVPAKIREALRMITKSAMCWGHTYLFDDFRAKNLGLDRDGRLVFIDAVFDARHMQKLTNP